MKTWSLIALESLEISEENEKVVGDQGSVCVCVAVGVLEHLRMKKSLMIVGASSCFLLQSDPVFIKYSYLKKHPLPLPVRCMKKMKQ
jgi:hypothetical protein